MSEILMALIVIAIPCSLFCAWLASKKGHGDWAWFVGCAVFGVLALIAIAGAPDHSGRKSTETVSGKLIEGKI